MKKSLTALALVATLLSACGQAGDRSVGASQARTASNLAAKVAPGFMWGVATAGHQWEGQDTTSNWAKWVQGGHTPDTNDQAVQGYQRYGEDMDLAKGLGANAFRFSIEWSRIEPAPGQIDRNEVAHYHQVLQGLRDRGMTPVVTLMHFAYPAWLDAQGGWEGDKAVEAYQRYVAFVAKEFGSEIQYYLTFNEPNMLLLCGYGNGSFPPGKKFAAIAALKVAKNLVAAHKAGYEAVHANDPDAKVSFNMYAAEYRIGSQPNLDTTDRSVGVRSAEAVTTPGPTSEAFFLGGAMGEGERSGKKYLDYVAFDYYCRIWVGFPVKNVPHDQWEVYPEGFYKAIKRYHEKTHLPVLIAENGMATYDLHPRKDGWTRSAYLVAHVKAMQKAMAEGVPVLGYIHWSITDNYEWGSYTPRFGLYSVEGKAGDFTRVPTDGAAAFRSVIAQGGVSPALDQQFAPPLARKL